MKTVHMIQQAKVTILKHSLHRKYVYSEGEQAHASSPGRWHTYHQQQVPASSPEISRPISIYEKKLNNRPYSKSSRFQTKSWISNILGTITKALPPRINNNNLAMFLKDKRGSTIPFPFAPLCKFSVVQVSHHIFLNTEDN